MYCVYIIYSKSIDSYYIGETIEIDERIVKHNSGFYEASYTKQSNDWCLFHKIDCKNRKQARLIEAHIKKMKSKVYIQNLKKYPEITQRLKEKYN